MHVCMYLCMYDYIYICFKFIIIHAPLPYLTPKEDFKQFIIELQQMIYWLCNNCMR